MWLAGGEEAAFHDDGRVFKQFGRILAFEEGLLHIEVGQLLLELDGIGHDGFRIRHILRQKLQVLLNLFGGLTGMLLRVGGHQRHDRRGG